MKKPIACIAAVLVAAVAASGLAAAAEDYSKEPGYVDLSELNVFGKQEADVEIYLDKGLLAFVGLAARNKDPELADMLSKLLQIRVQSFKIVPDKLEAIDKKTLEMAQKLESKGWSTMIKVRNRTEGSQTYIYSKLVSGKMQGLVVMNVDPKDEASFVNIVGEIDPEQLGRLQSKFDIDGLDSLQIRVQDKITDDVQKKRERK